MLRHETGGLSVIVVYSSALILFLAPPCVPYIHSDVHSVSS